MVHQIKSFFEEKITHEELDGYSVWSSVKKFLFFTYLSLFTVAILAFCKGNFWYVEEIIVSKLQAGNPHIKLEDISFETHIRQYSKVYVIDMGYQRTYLIDAGFLSQSVLIEDKTVRQKALD